MLGGFHPGDMVIVAGRPSMGKTAIVLNILEHAARVLGKGVVIYSLEMTRHQLLERIVCGVGEVDSHRVRAGTVTPEDYRRLKDACNKLQDANLFIDDTSSLTPFELRTRVRKLSRQHKIDLVVIDYVQLMHTENRHENRQQEISTISRQMKALAKELNVPVIVLSQLNRAPEGREDHRPRMSDLRESGSLEQDSDVVILLHREDYYHRGDPQYNKTYVAEVIVAKQRNGPTGTVELAFMEEFTKFVTRSLAMPPGPLSTAPSDDPFS